MEKTIKVVRQIERTHDGLGMYCMINQLCMVANKSIFNIATSGSGKQVIVGSVKRTKDVYPPYDLEFDSMTLTSIAKRISIAQSKKMIWRIFEFAVLNKYHRDLLLSIGSKIITDGNYTHTLGVGQNAMLIDIKDCKLSMLIGIQPNLFSNMVSGSEYWKALSNDRFIKLLIINPLRKKEVKTPPIFELADFTPKRFTMSERPPIMSHIFKGQVSDGRLNSLSRDMLSAYMSYEGYEKYTIKYELEFKQLFAPILKIFDTIYFTYDLDRPRNIKSGSMSLLEEIAKHRDGITQKELARTFKIYDMTKEGVDEDYKQDNIRNHARPLIYFGLIQKITEYPVKYSLSKSLLDYFDFYKGLIG